MTRMRLPVRQYRCYPLPGADYDEASFGYVERALELDAARTALITIDLWNTGWGDEPLDPELGRYAESSFLGLGARAATEARRRTADNLAPALQAARAAGMTIIHENAEAVVRRYPEQARFVETPSAAEPDWPPADGGEAVRAQYYRYSFGEGVEELYARMLEVLDFPEPVRPAHGDFCVCQQAAVEEILRERAITAVIHAGFLLSHCLLDNPGGLRSLAWPWRRPPLRAIVLRDCTIAQEYHSTVEGFRATEVFITWLEAIGIPTATAADLCAAATST